MEKKLYVAIKTHQQIAGANIDYGKDGSPRTGIFHGEKRFVIGAEIWEREFRKVLEEMGKGVYCDAFFGRAAVHGKTGMSAALAIGNAVSDKGATDEAFEETETDDLTGKTIRYKVHAVYGGFTRTCVLDLYLLAGNVGFENLKDAAATCVAMIYSASPLGKDDVPGVVLPDGISARVLPAWLFDDASCESAMVDRQKDFAGNVQ
jgi:hypothetical protein